MTDSQSITALPKILIVDDEEPLRKALVFDFKRAGFEVFDAENGEKAFQLLQNQAVDIVLTDVRMPVCDGIQLLDRIKTGNPKLPVVMFITGFTDLSPEDAYQKGAAAIFSKPFDRKALLASVKNGIIRGPKRWTDSDSSPSASSTHPLIQVSFSALTDAELQRHFHVGQGGMFLAIDPLPVQEPGVTIEFEVQIPSENSFCFKGKGVVRWCRHEASSTEGPKGLGIEFLTLSPESALWVDAFQSNHPTPTFIPKN